MARNDTPRGAASQAVILGSPNGETPRPTGRDGMPAGMTGQNAGTETSQYRDRKSKRELRSSGERTGACLNGSTLTGLEALSIRVAGHVGGGLQDPPAAQSGRLIEAVGMQRPSG